MIEIVNIDAQGRLGTRTYATLDDAGEAIVGRFIIANNKLYFGAMAGVPTWVLVANQDDITGFIATNPAPDGDHAANMINAYTDGTTALYINQQASGPSLYCFRSDHSHYAAEFLQAGGTPSGADQTGINIETSIQSHDSDESFGLISFQNGVLVDTRGLFIVAPTFFSASGDPALGYAANSSDVGALFASQDAAGNSYLWWGALNADGETYSWKRIYPAESASAGAILRNPLADENTITPASGYNALKLYGADAPTLVSVSMGANNAAVVAQIGIDGIGLKLLNSGTISATSPLASIDIGGGDIPLVKAGGWLAATAVAALPAADATNEGAILYLQPDGIAP